MKSFVLLVALFAVFRLSAQEDLTLPIDPETKQIKIQEIVEEPGSKNELFNRCVYWLNDFYNDPTRITTIRDVNTGKIEGNHSFKLYRYDTDSTKTQVGVIHYVFVVQMKDDRYRYTIAKLQLRSREKMSILDWLDKNDPNYQPEWESYIKQVVDFFDNWTTSLKDHMKPEKNKKSEDDW